MEKITMKDFEELISKDEALTAKAKEITGEGEARKKEIIAFAASLGYELECIGNMREITPDEMENVAGGTPGTPQDQSMSPAKQKAAECKKKGHDWVLQKREKGVFWGYNAYYICQRCRMEKIKWE